MCSQPGPLLLHLSDNHVRFVKLVEAWIVIIQGDYRHKGQLDVGNSQPAGLGETDHLVGIGFDGEDGRWKIIDDWQCNTLPSS